MFTSPIIAIIVCGIGVRLIIAPYFSWTTDVALWENVMQDMFNGLTMYATRSYSYPPLWIYTLTPLFIGIQQLGMDTGTVSPILSDGNMITPMVSTYLTSPGFNMIVKLPLILSDALVAWLIYDIIYKVSRKKSRAHWGTIIWLFNPLTILISVVLTQFDSLPILMTLLTFRFYLHNRYYEAGIAIMLGVLFKLYPLFLGCVFGALILRKAFDQYGFNILKVGRPVFLYGLGTVTVVLIFLPGLIGTEAFEVIFRRTQTTIIPQGVGIWFITYVPAIQTFVTEYNSQLHRFTFWFNMLIYGVCYIAPILSTRRMSVSQIGFLVGVVLLITVLFNDLAIAHYYSWSFPFLLIGIMLRPRINRIFIALLLILIFAGLSFMLAMWGYAVPALMYGFALNLNVIDPNAINAILFDLRAISGIINRYLFIDFMFLSAALSAISATGLSMYCLNYILADIHLSDILRSIQRQLRLLTSTLSRS